MYSLAQTGLGFGTMVYGGIFLILGGAGLVTVGRRKLRNMVSRFRR